MQENTRLYKGYGYGRQGMQARGLDLQSYVYGQMVSKRGVKERSRNIKRGYATDTAVGIETRKSEYGPQDIDNMFGDGSVNCDMKIQSHDRKISIYGFK